MRKSTIFGMLILFFSFPAINGMSQNEKSTELKLIVYYFHGTHRCATCRAIEENTKKVLETKFGNELANGIIHLKIINYDDEKNRDLTEKFEVAWSSLFLVGTGDNEDFVKNMTDFAFRYGRTNPEKFQKGLTKAITEQIK